MVFKHCTFFLDALVFHEDVYSRTSCYITKHICDLTSGCMFVDSVSLFVAIALSDEACT